MHLISNLGSATGWVNYADVSHRALDRQHPARCHQPLLDVGVERPTVNLFAEIHGSALAKIVPRLSGSRSDLEPKFAQLDVNDAVTPRLAHERAVP